MRSTSRYLALGALIVAAIAVFVVFKGSDPYLINARFVDAGQLVEGGLVQVGGRKVGTIEKIRLADDGVANLVLAIDDEEVAPLRRGTLARIRTVGLTGVANRFVEVVPGPSTGEEIADNGVLSTAETRGIVDLDVLFNAFDPQSRDRLQRIIRNGATVFKGQTTAANKGLAYLAPALFQSRELAEELVYDRVALERLLQTGAVTARALASRPEDISQGITSTAATLRAVASQREALANSLENAPALLERPDGVLGGLKTLATEVRPVLGELRPVAPRLVRVLRELVPTSRQSIPVLEQTRSLFPPLIDGLNGLPGLQREAVPALRSSVNTIISLMPIVDGLRPYTPEIALGVVSGLGSRATGYFDANGHFARINLNQPPQGISGIFNAGTGLGGFETGQGFRCPGGATEPADDNSNPYIEDDSTCDASASPGLVRRLLAVAMVALTALLAAVIVGAPAESAGTYRVDAIFDTAKGIIPGQVVKVAGARVGFVEDVVLTEDYKARIVMSVPRRFTFHKDASCNIQPEGLIAENFVQCDPGTPSDEELDGDPAPTVPVEQTAVPVSITDLFKIFQADVRQRFTVAMMAVGGGLASRGEDLNEIIRRSNPTLAAVRRLTADLAAQKEQISAAVRDTDLLVARLAERKDKVARLHRAGRPRDPADRRPARPAGRVDPPPAAAAGPHRHRHRRPRPPARRRTPAARRAA